MSNNLENIDKLYKDALSDYSPPKKGTRWFRLGLKLMILNLGSYFAYGGIIMIIALAGGGIYYAVNYDSSTKSAYDEIFKTEEFLKLTTLSYDFFRNKQESIYPIELRDKNVVDGSSAAILDNEHLQSSTNNSKSNLKSIPGKPKLGSFINSTHSIEKSNTPVYQQLGNSDPFIIESLAFQHILNNSENKLNLSNTNDLQQINFRTEIQDSLQFMKKNAINSNFEFFISPDIGWNKLSLNDDQYNHVDFRNTYEKPAITFSTGAEIKIEKNQWFIQSGLNYSIYGENANYSVNVWELDPDKTVLEMDTTWRWVYDPPNIGEPRIMSIDSVYIPYYNQRLETYSVNNRYHFIEIPVVFGRQFIIKQFTADISTGFSFGFAIKYSGRIPNTDNESLIELSSLKSNAPAVNYILQAGLYYPLSENMNILFKPVFKYNLNGIFKDEDYNVKQQFISFGLRLGISIDF